jgi:hypothetical protein
VWELLGFDRLPEWGDYREDPPSVEYTSEVNTPEDKYRVGVTAQGIPKKPGDDYCRYEITESLEHEKITHYAWEKTMFGILTEHTTFALEPVGTDTKFTFELESEMSFGFFGKFLEKVFARRWTEKQMQKMYENLKNILE